MKKVRNFVVATGAVCVFTALFVCAGTVDFRADSMTRIESARFNSKDGGEIVTSDGNVWGYSADVLDDAFVATDGSIVFSGMTHEVDTLDNDVPAWVRFDDGGTPDVLDDDVILAVGLDFSAYMTERTDAMEVAQRHNWELIEKYHN